MAADYIRVQTYPSFRTVFFLLDLLIIKEWTEVKLIRQRVKGSSDCDTFNKSARCGKPE